MKIALQNCDSEFCRFDNAPTIQTTMSEGPVTSGSEWRQWIFRQYCDAINWLSAASCKSVIKVKHFVASVVVFTAKLFLSVNWKFSALDYIKYERLPFKRDAISGQGLGVMKLVKDEVNSVETIDGDTYRYANMNMSVCVSMCE